MQEDEIRPSIEDTVFVNPLTDFGFKLLFGDEGRLKIFLSILVGRRITAIRHISTEVPGSLPSERKAVFDLFCYTSKEEYFIVEMQVGRQTYFADRAIFYTSCALRNQAEKGIYWNYKLKAVYFVGILTFDLFREPEVKDVVIERIVLWRTVAQKLYSDKQNLIFVELGKFNKTIDEVKTKFEMWLYMLKHAYTMTDVPDKLAKDKDIRQIFEILKVKLLKPEEMETYKKSLMDYYEVQDMAVCERQEGRAEGLAEGLAKGQSEALNRIVLHMRDTLHYSVEKIATETGLHQVEVFNILDKNLGNKK